jgi:hypothetical protein
MTMGTFTIKILDRQEWLTPIILATRRITVQGQLSKKQTLSQKYPTHIQNKGLVEWLKW